MNGTRTPVAAAVIGLVIATLAGLVLLGAGMTALIILQDQVVGLAYLAAGTIPWRRRPDNAIGPLLVAIGYAWYIPDFHAAPIPWVAGPGIRGASTGQRVVCVSAAFAFPSGRRGLARHRIAMGLVIGIAAIQIPSRLLLTDRVPADLGHVDRITIAGCDCVNPFAVTAAPGSSRGSNR